MSISIEIFKQTLVLLFAVGLGILSSTYSPFYSLVGVALFCLLSFFLYSHSFQTQPQAAMFQNSEAEQSQRSFLFTLFYLSFVLSITIPKAGRTFSNLPITVANLCIAFTLICWALYSIFSRKTFIRPPLFMSTSLFILYGVFASVLGVVKGSYPKLVLLDFVVFVGFIPVYFLVCGVVKTKRQILNIIAAVVVSLMLVSIYGILQPKLGFERIAIPGLTEQYNKAVYGGVGKWNVIEGGGQKVYSTFQNGNVFGNHLALFIPLLSGCLMGLSTISLRKRIFFVMIFFLASYTLLITFSRGALLSTVGGIAFLTLLAKKIRLKAIVIGLIILTVVFIFIQYYGEQPELTRYDFRRIQNDPDRFSAGRVFRIKFVLQRFSEYPLMEKLFGRGFGSGLTVQRNCDYTDNLYLTMLFKCGIFGVLLLFWVLFKFFRQLLRLYANTEDEQLKGILAGGIAGMIAALIHYLADALWLFPPLAANFWFLAGIAMMVGEIGSQQGSSQEKNSTNRSNIAH